MEIDFIKNIKKVSEPRKHTIKNSYGVYDGYKFYRKNKPKESKYVLTESQYFSIIRKINSILAEGLTRGEDIVLPERFGRIEIRKSNARVQIVNGKVVSNLPIDWDRTLKLWYEDIESFNNKTLVKVEEKEIYKIYYNKNNAEYSNKSFYQINFNRELKKKLKYNIKDGNLDAFNFNYYG